MAVPTTQVPVVKNGLRTTEFWVAIAGAAIPIVNKIFALNIPEEAVYTLVAYIIGRSGVKAIDARRVK